MDAFPEFAPPRVEIQTICLGLSAAEVEELVTVPLEQALNGVTRLDVIRSKSVPQLSSIELDLQARHRPDRRRGSWSRSAWRRSVADAADVGGAAGDAPPLSTTEPGHEDRRLVGDDVA